MRALDPSLWPGIDPAVASRCATLALAGVRREYPNKLDHVMGGPSDVRGPRELHPAFYGCYDWHSAVHGHWLLVRVLRVSPGVSEREAIVACLNEHLAPGCLAGEVAYLERPLSRAFERTYGWAWALKLHEELGRLAGAPDPPASAAAWAGAMAPLGDAIARRFLGHLPGLTYPIRSGVHANSAFGLGFAYDWACWSGNDDLRTMVESKALEFFLGDRDLPARFEPSGTDFFSASLVESDLMRRVLPGEEFGRWFKGAIPGVVRGEPGTLFRPVHVADRTDPQIVHLDGLNLGRAWCMRSVAGALADGVERVVLLESAREHERASLGQIASGDYVGEHWLATFAALCLSGA